MVYRNTVKKVNDDAGRLNDTDTAAALQENADAPGADPKTAVHAAPELSKKKQPGHVSTVKVGVYSRKMIVAATLCTAFVTPFTGSSLNLSVPAIGADFGVSASAVGWIVTIYSLAVAAFAVPCGRIADITSRRKILLLGIGVFFICCMLSAAAPGFPILLAVRGLQGIAAAMMFSTTIPIVIAAFPPQQRGRAIGFNLVGTYTGLSTGPVLGGIINHYLGWRVIFIFTGIVALIAFIMVFAKVPEDEGAGSIRVVDKSFLDIKGNLLFVFSVIILVFGLSEIMDLGIAAYAMIAAGLILIVLFVVHENRTEKPVLDVSLFRRNIGFGLSNLAALFNYAASVALGYLVSLYLQVCMGFSSQTAGFIMISQPVIMALLSPRMGGLSDRISPFKLSSLGMFISGAGIAMFIFAREDTPIWYIVIALCITGAGFSLFSSPNTNAIMSCVEKKDYGIASSLVSTMRTMGQTVGMVIVTIVVSSYMGHMPLAEASPQLMVRVISTSFVIFAVICFVGVIISLQRKDPGKE